MSENEFLDENDPEEMEETATDRQDRGHSAADVSAPRDEEAAEDTEDEYDPYEEERRRELEERAKKKRRKRSRSILKKLIILALVIAAVAFFFIRRAQKSTEVAYQSDTAAVRDLSTTNSYTGTIEAVDSQSVMSAVSGVKVTEVLVEEGDTVQEGDVIARLDTSNIDEQISEKEATMNASATSNALNIQSAQAKYNNLKQNLDDGLDQSTQNASAQIDSAMQNLVSAQQSYNDEVNLNNAQLSQIILSAIQQMETAYNNVQSAALRTQQSVDSKSHAQQQASDAGKTYDSFSDDQQIESNELSEEQAWDNYEQAKTSYEQAKINEENRLTELYDAVITAQNNYLNAIDSYNATVRSTQQTLEEYQRSIQQAEANADSTTSQLQLDNLKDSLSDYVITAPMSGTVTTLNIKVGDITAVSATSTLATITSYDKMKVTLSVSEYDVSNLSKGDKVTVTVDAVNKDFEGTVSAVSAVGSSSNGIAYFSVEVQFTPDSSVMVGMTADVRQTISEAKNVVTVLSDAVATGSDGSSYVLVKGTNEKGKDAYVQQAVTLGSSDGTYTEITSGLNAGDTVYYADNTSAAQDMSSMMFGMDDSEVDMDMGMGGGPGGPDSGAAPGGPGGGAQ